MRRLGDIDDSESVLLLLNSPRKRSRFPAIASGATNVTFQQHKVTREERANALGRLPGFRGCTLWFTGLSGAGKTTIAFALEKALVQLGVPAYALDGDNIRHGLCKNLGFSAEERAENIRRVAEVAKLFSDLGMVVLASFISPFRAGREEARRIHSKENIPFFEIFVDTPIEVCEARDPKKLYKKARAGKIRGFTGVDSDYEAPLQADLVLSSGVDSETKCLQQMLQFLFERNVLPENAMFQFCGQSVRQLFVPDDISRRRLLSGIGLCPAVHLSLVDLQWLQVLAEGWASPLPGFMRERQYLQCLHFGQLLDLQSFCGAVEFAGDPFSLTNGHEKPYPLANPISQSVPIVLPIDTATKLSIECVIRKQRNSPTTGEMAKVRLLYEGSLVAVLCDPEIFEHRKEERICRQFGHFDKAHPTIRQILDSGDWLLGGEVHVFERIVYGDGLDTYRKTPAELRREFAARQSDCVFAFQLRNPVHNGHALLMHSTREQLLRRGYRNPILLLHPLGGWTKDDDVPLKVRIAQHEAVLKENVLDADWTVLAIFPSPMLYAGPTEVQWHARARLACGVNAYIVGRDPAGIQNPRTGDYLYEPSHGAKVLSMTPGLVGLEIIPFRVAAYDSFAGAMAFYDPNRHDNFMFISGTMMRKLAREGRQPPEGFMPPKAWEVLSNYYRTQNGNEHNDALTEDARKNGSTGK
ncbi:hypothetical protein niasHS_003705 [Heterodera schachtii]|uniref:Uncharacterized protein n=1 Tax=Heterodera schachtii TaxID=97005 RepID=A0ABD2KHD6_HETSC